MPQIPTDDKAHKSNMKDHEDPNTSVRQYIRTLHCGGAAESHRKKLDVFYVEAKTVHTESVVSDMDKKDGPDLMQEPARKEKDTTKFRNGMHALQHGGEDNKKN